MSGVKEYSIKINGLTQSISAVDALNKQLDRLEERMNRLGSSKLSVSSGSKALSEEEAVQKEINRLKAEGEKLDAKIAATQNEVYQKVLATKELYKEMADDQKTMAAAERLQANTYSNTMRGMKQKLADIKSTINVTDLGDSDKIEKMTKEADALTKKLLEMEKAYGQFGRQVGNYQSAFDGMTKFKVQVGEVTREFNSAREASRTLKQELLGLEDQGTPQAQELKKAISEVDSAIKDATVSSQAMDAAMDWIQSFVSLAQAGHGIAAFFGVDDSKMQQTIKDLLAIQNAVNGIEKIMKQVQSEEGIGQYFGKASKSIDEFTNKLFKVKNTTKETTENVSTQAKETNKLTTATQGATAAEGAQATANVAVATTSAVATAAAKLLSFALKAIGIGIALEAIALLVDGIKSAASAIYEFFSGAEEEAQKLKDSVNGVMLVTGNMMDIYDEAAERGAITQVQKLTQEYETQATAAKDLVKTLSLLRTEDAYKELGKGAEDYIGKLNRMSAIANRYNQAQKDLENGVDGAANRMAKLADEYRKVYTEFKNTTDIQVAGDKIKAFSDDLESYAKAAQGAEQATTWMFNNFNNVTKAIEEGQKAIDKFTKTDTQRQKAELAKEKDLALKYAKTEEEKTKIKEGYNKKVKEIDDAEAKRRQQEYETQQREVEQRNTTLENLKLRLMKDGLAKRLIMLDNEKRATIEKLKGNHDAQLKAEKAYLEIRQQTIDKFFKEVKTKELEYNKFELEARSNKLKEEIRNTETKAKKEENSEPSYLVSYWNDYKTLREVYDRRKEIVEHYYETDLVTLESYYNKIREFENEQAQIELDSATASINKKYDAERETIDNRVEDLKRVLDKEVDVNSETYKKVNEAYEQALKDKRRIEELYNGEMANAQTEFENKSLGIEEKYMANVQKMSSKSYSIEISNLREYLNEAIYLMSNQPTMIKGWDIVNLPKTKRDLKEAKEAIKHALQDIQDEMHALRGEKALGTISDAEYNALMKNLLELKKQAVDAGVQVNESLKQLGADFYGSIDRWVQEVGQAASSILSSLAEISRNEYDKQISELEKYIDQYEELLNKQDEITQQHADKINSIEDELKTARGDRRQELIDNLNAEMAAQRASLEQKKKIEREEKRLDYEKQLLEWEAAKKEHEINLWQAAVNAAMMVSMAAVNKWPIPAIPMMTLAAAVGAAQLAAVASTPLPEKPTPKYANGGVLEGASHAQGGIKVLGGQAEVEGGEYITNRQTTSSNVELLDFINSKRRRIDISDMIEFYNGNTRRNLQANKYKFADGGQLPMLRNDISLNNEVINAMNAYANKPTVVQVVDIVDATDNLNKVKVLSGLQGS